jgi:hypothetical protein
MRRRCASAHRRHERYFVVEDELLLDPLGLVADVEPDGDVDELPVDPEPVVLLLPGVVVLPGEAEGVEPGVLPTRSDSVRLQAAVAPARSARAQRPESNLFISGAPPCGVFDHGAGVQRTCL